MMLSTPTPTDKPYGTGTLSDQDEKLLIESVQRIRRRHGLTVEGDRIEREEDRLPAGTMRLGEILLEVIAMRGLLRQSTLQEIR